MGFSSGLLTGILAMIFMVMLVIPTAVHFVTAAKPVAPSIDPGIYREIAALEIELFGQTQENGGPPYYESGIVSLAPPEGKLTFNEVMAAYGYGHESCQFGNCAFIDEDARPW
jgi:hypothetical protein